MCSIKISIIYVMNIKVEAHILIKYEIFPRIIANSNFLIK